MPNSDSSRNISSDKLNDAFKMASSKLGMTPDQLKSTISNPKSLEELLDKIGGKKAYQSAKTNPEQLEKLIKNNPQARKMLSELMGDPKNG